MILKDEILKNLNFKKAESGFLLDVKVKPGSKNSEIIGIENGILIIKLSSPPVDGKANIELMKILKKELGLKNIKIIKGEKSKEKLIKFSL